MFFFLCYVGDWLLELHTRWYTYFHCSILLQWRYKGFDRNRSNFLLSASFGVMIWICDDCSGDNSFSYCSAVLIQNQGYFIFSNWPASEVSVHKDLGEEDTARTSEQDRPKEYLTPYSLVLGSAGIKKRGRDYSEWWHLFCWVNIMSNEAHAWTLARWWEFLFFLYSCMLFVLYLIS